MIARPPRPTRRPVLRSALLLGLVGGGLFLVIACTPSTPLVGAGGECFAATDCEPGLVCVPQRSGSRQCSSDLTMVTGRPPPEAGAMDTGDGDAPNDSPMIETGEDTSIPDTSMPDTSKPDAAEAG